MTRLSKCPSEGFELNRNGLSSVRFPYSVEQKKLCHNILSNAQNTYSPRLTQLPGGFPKCD
eukprot:4878709-Amphidinium_carterae.1